MFNGMIDVSHHNGVADWAAVRRAGVVAVIHKASEGATFRDPAHDERRRAVEAEGLLWGSYHYSSGASVEAQVRNYLAAASPADDELICLDFEASSAGRDMDHAEMEEFVERLRAEIGRAPVIYGGTRLRRVLKTVTGSSVGACPLWYRWLDGTPRRVPTVWKSWTFWQYTNGKSGAEPHEVDGVGPVDRNIFNGSQAEFYARWPF